MNPDSIDSAESVTNLYIGYSVNFVDFPETVLNPWQIRLIGGM